MLEEVSQVIPMTNASKQITLNRAMQELSNAASIYPETAFGANAKALLNEIEHLRDENRKLTTGLAAVIERERSGEHSPDKPISGERHLFSCAKIKEISYYDTCDCGASAHETSALDVVKDSHRWLYAEKQRLESALRRIINEGDYTAPDGMKRIARDALASSPVETSALPEHVHSWDGDQCHYCHIPRSAVEKASADDIPAHSLAAFAAGCQCQWCTIKRSAENGTTDSGKP